MPEEYIYKKVDKIIFGLLSSKQIRKMASTKIVTAELYDKEGYPVDGGLMDVRLGVIDPGLRCKTCGSKLKECIGHFGYIELARPIIHVKYLKYILNVLKSVCRECGRILVTDEKISAYGIDENLSFIEKRKRAKVILEELKTVKKCPHCQAKQLTVKIEKPTSFFESDRRLSPIEIRTRFEKIPDKDVELLGLNPAYARPEWMILTVMPIPPVTIRPSITLESGERSEDDLTHKLGDIVRINQRLFENINAGAPEVIVEDLWDLLQYHVTTYIDNDIAQVPPARHRSGQPLKTLTERIKSKEGRFRHNLAGKRVNYSARTVISPDPKIKFDEVGVPKIVAMELTVPERVNEWNIERLKEFITRGSNIYPGANYVVRPDGKKKRITDETKEQLLEELQYGYIVERHLMNGDISIFNRQPSLHRMSIMCHKVKVLSGRSFRLNPAVCVAPDTLIQLSTGIQRPIDELKNCWKESELATYHNEGNKITKTELKKFWGLKPEEYGTKCYKITTENGRSIIATADHPFYTKGPIKKVSELNNEDLVIVRPLDTPIYKEFDKIILNEEDIKKIAPKETYIKHSIRLLRELKLLPLNLIDQRTMILSRLIGHLFGDGTFILKRDTARLIFRGSKEDLENIQNDIKSLGFNPEKIYIKTTGGEIHTIRGKTLHVMGSYPYFEVRNKPLALLFAALGAPNGDKVKLNYEIPKWIQDSPLHIKREFIASYFGSELTTPRVRNSSNSNFASLVFKISKIKGSEVTGYNFINTIKKLLEEFEVNIKSIKEEDSNIRKNGEHTVSLVASITDNKSILNMFGKIGYIYSSKKDNIARVAYQYLLLKEKKVKERKEKYKKFVELRNKKIKFKEISKLLNVSIGTLETWAYKHKDAGLSSNFMGFEEWKNISSAGPGLIYEKIENIKENYCPFVYDVTTTSDTHNFFANGFLTKNCSPYNADFDGDEMNLHIPQNEEAMAEAEILMHVPTQIISPKNGMNVVGCIHDAITGNYILTSEIEMSKQDAIQLIYSIGVNNFEALNKAKVNGRDIFSCLLPNDFNFVGESKGGKTVIIKKGKLIEGVIDKATIGEDNGSLIRSLYAKYDALNALEIVGRIFRLGIAVLLKNGFTTTLTDTDLNNDVIAKNKEVTTRTYEKIQELIDEYKKGNLDAMPGTTVEETLENMILKLLNRLRDRIGEIVFENITGNNSTILMVKSGAQGNFLNLAQMAACVGQQSIGGKRLEKGYDKRNLSLFEKGSLDPRAKGFIKQGYKSGLDPVSYFFHVMTGRDALMDTALRTPKSGYMYRRLANALQDLKVEYDSTVRDANRKIIQFIYGDDGVDVSKSEGGVINVDKIVKEVKEI